MTAFWDCKLQIQLFYIAVSCVLLVGFLVVADAKPWNLQNIIDSITPKVNFGPKPYSGKCSENGEAMIYYHNSTMAVTAWGPDDELLCCELIRIGNDSDVQMHLDNIYHRNSQPEVGLEDMTEIMKKCHDVDKRNFKPSPRLFFSTCLLPYHGIYPGTKWCGPGDIARTYDDLGEEIDTDRCCRQHDFCPISIPANETKYDLFNNNQYTV